MSLFARIREDIDSVLERDPAARSRLEVFLCYPGLWAVWIHRVAHQLWRAKWRLAARLLSQVGRFFTGVDIHPGALLGRRLFIDHATGVVIGETAIVGSDVTLYQGVTLGGRAAQFDGCGCPGAHRLSQRTACVDYRSARGKRSTLRCDHRAFSPRGGTGEAPGRRSAAGRAVHRRSSRTRGLPRGTGAAAAVRFRRR